LVKLRFPEHEMIDECIVNIVADIEELDCRDLALVCWALGRIDFKNTEISNKLEDRFS
jgi:hypothetical protein